MTNLELLMYIGLGLIAIAATITALVLFVQDTNERIPMATKPDIEK